MTDTLFDPDRELSTRPIDALRKVLHSRESSAERRFWHPRRDHVWLERKNSVYVLSIRRGKESYILSDEAIKQLASIFDVPVSLLERLRALPKENEDTLLINKLLWHAGASDEYRLQGIVSGKYLNKVFTGEYAPVLMLSLANMLNRAEEEGRLRLISFELNGPSTWLVLGHKGMDPFSFSEKGNDNWFAGAVVLNKEDGGSAAVIAPALISKFGGRALIVPGDPDVIKRRRHKDVSSRDLTRLLLSDIDATRKAPYAEVVKRVRSLQRVRVASHEMRSALESTRIRNLTSDMRNQIIQKTNGEMRSLYWLVSQVLTASRNLPVERRFQVALDLGQFVWARGRELASTPRSAQ